MFEQVKFSNPPLVLAAWPGMGNVGIITVDYLRGQLGAEAFAEIDMSPFFIPESIVVKEGIAQFPEIPASTFYYHNNPDLIIFESNAQIGGRDGITIIKTILEIIEEFQVSQVFTFAAFAQQMSYQNDSQVLFTCNNPSLFPEMTSYGMSPMPDGYIAGMNGILLGVAASKKVNATCLLGTIPNYAVSLSYPKASLELVKVISSLMQTPIDTSELETAATDMEEQLVLIEERIREFFPSVNKEEDQEISEIEEERIPHYVMERIEKLFQEAAKNKEKANELKRELDRWNLFELYEDRFLDLFKGKPGDR